MTTEGPSAPAPTSTAESVKKAKGAGRCCRVVRERIDPRLTSSLFRELPLGHRRLARASRQRRGLARAGAPAKVDLVVRPESIVLTVIGGAGMGPAELESDYLRWGASRKRAGDRIGRYGQGGKAAIGHLGNRFTVTASRAGDERAIMFEDPVEVRRGDLWDQLETALREVCVTIPEATVPEFERKVNELMLVSLSLTGRPKRRRSGPVVRQSKGAWAG